MERTRLWTKLNGEGQLVENRSTKSHRRSAGQATLDGVTGFEQSGLRS
jgi:hypothetical protein